jgi:hypothetical protein
MELATIKRKISITETLRAMPVGVEQVVSARFFKAEQIRKAANKLKAVGYEFKVSNMKTLDTYVTRLR